jgi:nitrate reductase delta subunit
VGNFDFEFDLFGQGKKDRSLEGQVKDWVRDHHKVPAEVTILVAEIFCDQPGCAPIETHVAILKPGAREQFRIMRPLKEVIKQDIPRMIPNPDGHGARIDLDTLGDGSKWK